MYEKESFNMLAAAILILLFFGNIMYHVFHYDTDTDPFNFD